MTIDNSRENYFYWKGIWKDDFKAIVVEFYRMNMQSASFSWNKARSLFGSGKIQTLCSLFWFVWTVCIWAGALVMIPALSLILLLITLILLVYTNTVAYELSLVESLYLSLHKMQLLCPVCHRSPQHKVPTYRCPGCGALHEHLVPSARYGAFYQVCSNCKTHLPTSRFFGRHKLSALCSYEECRAPFDKNIESTALQTVAFIGAPSVGKTCLLTALMSDMVERDLPQRGWELSYPTDEDKGWAERLVKDLAAGNTPASTRGDVRALCMDARKNAGTIQRLYFYDPPGEVFGDAQQVASQLYYSHLKVALFIIDPFSIPQLQDELKAEGIELNTRSGAISPEESLNHWLISMEQDFASKMKKVACAVIINKTDVAELAQLGGLTPEASPEACENFLTQYGMGHLLNTLETSFASTSLFAIAAHPENGSAGSATKPQGIEPVKDWVLSQLKLQ